MRLVTKDDKLFFFERNFFTLDGLWVLTIEKVINWDTAFKIDLTVWKKMLAIVFRRLKKYLKIQTNNLEDAIEILTFRWSIEGWGYEIIRNEDEIIVRIKECPYKAMMDRNPKRHDKIPVICNEMCVPLYQSAITGFNDNILVERRKYKDRHDRICDFILKQENTPSSKPELAPRVGIYYEVSEKDKLYYFQRNFLTLDGLFMIETENELDFDIALKIDIKVWQDLYKIIFRRVKKYLNIHNNSLEDLVEILSFVWNCEGYSIEIEKKDLNEAIIKITACSYIEGMKRNPERQGLIATICKNMCIHYLTPVIEEFNKNIQLKRDKFLGLDDEICDFHFIAK
jgi:hypothetical protein